MIPLLHFATFISALFCFFASRRLYCSYQETRSVNVGDFLKAYIALGIYFFLVSLPAIILNPAVIQIIYILSYIPVILSATFLFRVALRILRFYLWPGYISFIIYSLILIVTALNIIFFSPAYITSSGGLFYHWSEGTPPWLQIFNGFAVGILAASCVFLFFLGGLKSKERLVRARSFLIGGGLFFLVIAALLNYILPVYLRGMIGWLVSALASLIALLGLISMLLGVYYRRKDVPGY
jgi:hypothetical protein